LFNLAENTYLEKLNEEELRAREIEKEKRKVELEKVEEVLKKTKQVKFLANITELEDIKRYASISHQTQSEFIRSSIREKIERLKSGEFKEKVVEEKKGQEEILRQEELQKIRKILEKLV